MPDSQELEKTIEADFIVRLRETGPPAPPDNVFSVDKTHPVEEDFLPGAEVEVEFVLPSFMAENEFSGFYRVDLVVTAISYADDDKDASKVKDQAKKIRDKLNVTGIAAIMTAISTFNTYHHITIADSEREREGKLIKIRIPFTLQMNPCKP